MRRLHLLHLTRTMIAIFVTMLLACNAQVNEKESTTEPSVNSINPENREAIPDSVIQFLISSAAIDFNEHQPPTAIDLRNVKAGYIASGNERTYLICGEFLSKEKKDWEFFTTIKTSGYEQYIGSTTYCQKASFVETDNNRLAEEIKSKLTELKK